jgi:diguanylate cyclase (GGDEF)-like protein
VRAEGVGSVEAALVGEARSLLGVPAAYLFAVDHERMATLVGADPSPVGVVSFSIDSVPGLADQLTRGQAVRLSGADADELAAVSGLDVGAEGGVLVAARAHEDAPGYALLLEDAIGRPLTSEGIEAAAAFVTAAAASMAQLRLMERQTAQNARQSALARAAKALNESLDLGRVLPRICAEAAAILDAESVMVYRGSAAKGLVLEASNSAPDLIGARLEPGAGIAGRAIAAGRPMLSNDYARDAAPAPGSPFADVRSALAAPMQWDGELRGVLWVGYRREHTVTEEDLRLLESFAELAAVACRNASVHAGLAVAARTDALTGCLNHAALHETLRREMQRSRRTGRRLSIVLVDLDHFKQVNERHGHLVGDEVLRRVGRSLRDAVRPYDFVARYGGDEFAIVAVDAHEERATEIAQRAITRLGPALDEVLGDPTGPHATAGVAEWTGAVAPSELVRQADRALLYGKQEGIRGIAIKTSTVPDDFMLGRTLGDDATPDTPQDRAPWPSAVQRETEPLRKRTQQLTLANALGARLSELNDVNEILDVAVEELHEAFGYLVTAVVRVRPDGSLEPLAMRGDAVGEGFRSLRPTDVIERAISERQTVLVNELRKPRGHLAAVDEARAEVALPVFVDGEVWGVLDVRAARPDAFREPDARLLETVADQLGAALRSATLYEQLDTAYLGTAEALAAALEAKGVQSAAEAQSIVVTAEAVARRLGLAGDALRDVRYAAALHDVGKIAVPESILNKSGPLTPAERQEVERHALVGEQILKPVHFLSGVAPLVRHGHENWDGTGYPDRLAGEEIPVGARVIQVCDAHHAMTTDRPYRKALSPALATKELRECAGSQFDQRVVEALLEVVSTRQAPAA